MASPQTEDGYTRIANELLDALICADLTKRQLRVALAIVRQTYGYNRKSDDMSGSRLASITGMARQHCNAALLELTELQVISRVSSRWGTNVSIQKDYELWQCLAQKTSDTKTVHTKDSKDNSKDTLKDNARESSEEMFDRWWKSYPKKRNRGQALKAWKKISPDHSLLEQMIESVVHARQSPDWQKHRGQYIPYPATWLNAESWLDEYVVDIETLSTPTGPCGATVANLQQLFGDDQNGQADIRRADRVSLGRL